MSNELESAAIDYSKALYRFNYSSGDAQDQWHQAERLQEDADQQAIDNLLSEKRERFLALLREETDANRLKNMAYRNMNDLEDPEVLVPILERWLELCGPNILAYLLLNVLCWTYGEDERAQRYFDMAAEINSDSRYVLRHRLLNTSDSQDQIRICKSIVEKYPDDPVAAETIRRIEQNIEPFLPSRVSEHTSIDFVLARLNCNSLE